LSFGAEPMHQDTLVNRSHQVAREAREAFEAARDALKDLG
jgi:hypothetical protein